MFKGSLTASLQFGRLVGTPRVPEKLSLSNPRARKTNCIAKIDVWIEVPRHQFFLEFLILVDSLIVSTGCGKKIGGGSQRVIGCTHGLDFLSRVDFCIIQ
jgi:hypothetical protein